MMLRNTIDRFGTTEAFEYASREEYTTTKTATATATATTRVTFETSPFMRSHFHSPRGRGSWAFSTESNPDVLGPTMLWSPSMTFGEAKSWARQQVQGRGRRLTLFVQP